MTPPPVGYVAHVLPGRVRVRVPARRGDAAFFDRVAERLGELPSVTSVIATPLTGSVVVEFTGEIQALALAAMALSDEVRLELAPPPTAPLMLRVRREVAAADAAIREATGGELDARAAAFCVLLAFSALQLLRGNLLAPTVTLLWYAAVLGGEWQLMAPPAGRAPSAGA